MLDDTDAGAGAEGLLAGRVVGGEGTEEGELREGEGEGGPHEERREEESGSGGSGGEL